MRLLPAILLLACAVPPAPNGWQVSSQGTQGNQSVVDCAVAAVRAVAPGLPADGWVLVLPNRYVTADYCHAVVYGCAYDDPYPSVVVWVDGVEVPTLAASALGHELCHHATYVPGLTVQEYQDRADACAAAAQVPARCG